MFLCAPAMLRHPLKSNIKHHMTRLTLTLWENAISFLTEALAKAVAAENNAAEWKFAIFNLVQAIELTAKERLRREHQMLVFADVDNPKTSVSLEKAIARLARVPSVKLTADDIKGIQLAVSIRNSITHHEVDASVEQIQVVFANLLGFIADFSRRQLQVEISVSVPEQIWNDALKVNRHTMALCSRAEQQISDEGIESRYILTCLKCAHDTYVDKPDVQKCYLCGFDDETTVCQECGIGMFKCEGHAAYYGKWRNYGSKKAEDWYPYLCNDCYDDFLENGPALSREASDS